MYLFYLLRSPQWLHNCQEQTVPAVHTRECFSGTLRELSIKHKDEKPATTSTLLMCRLSEKVEDRFLTYTAHGFLHSKSTVWIWFQGCSFKIAKLHPVAHQRADPGSQPSPASESLWARNERAGHIHQVEWISCSQKTAFYSETLFSEYESDEKVCVSVMWVCLRVPSG